MASALLAAGADINAKTKVSVELWGGLRHTCTLGCIAGWLV